MKQKLFATTGKAVSVLGLGTVKFGRNTDVKYPGGEGFPLPTDKQIEEILDTALTCGITLLDTAPAYGSSEERLGQLLGPRRDKMFLMSKTGEEFDGKTSSHHFDAAHTRMSVERSLKRLNTNYLDCVLLHCNRDDENIVKNTAAFETLSRLKEEGKILSYGASTYTLAAGRYTVDHADAVMVAYHSGYRDEKPIIDYAHERDKAVLIKKGLASGHVGSFENLAENIRFIIDTPGVTSLIFGSLTPANILANTLAVN